MHNPAHNLLFEGNAGEAQQSIARQVFGRKDGFSTLNPFGADQIATRVFGPHQLMEILYAGYRMMVSDSKWMFWDYNSYIQATSSGNMKVYAETLLTLGKAGDTTFGDGTERNVYPQTDLKINLGLSGSNRYGRLSLGQRSGSTGDGDFWYDDTQQALQGYIGKAATPLEQTFSTCPFTATASATVANTTTETSILGTGVGTKTLPANFFVAGKTLRVVVKGHIADTGTPTLRIRCKLGSTTIVDTGAQTLLAITGTRGFEAEFLLTCRTTGASGTVFGQGDFQYNSAAVTGNVIDAPNTAATTVDTTASQAVDVTATWGTASASNTITGTNVTIEVLN